MRLQADAEETALDHPFTEPSLDHSEHFLREMSAGLEVTRHALHTEPKEFDRQLELGYIRLIIDEARMAEKDKEHGGDRDRTWREVGGRTPSGTARATLS